MRDKIKTFRNTCLSGHLSDIESDARQARKSYGDWKVCLAILENIRLQVDHAIKLAEELTKSH